MRGSSSRMQLAQIAPHGDVNGSFITSCRSQMGNSKNVNWPKDEMAGIIIMRMITESKVGR